MKTIETIRLFYIIYSIYTVFILLVSDYNVLFALVGLICIWCGFLSFELGYYSVNKKSVLNETRLKQMQYPMARISEWSAGEYTLALCAAWMSAVLAAKYYTGKSFLGVIHGLLGGESSYNSYQQYFSQHALGTFSLSKIPFVIMLAYLFIIMMWSIIGLLLDDKRCSYGQLLYLAGVVCAYMYFGLSRGTNFETYIVFILISYCLLQRMSSAEFERKLKFFIVFFLLGVLMVLAFRIVIMRRGAVFANKLCAEISFLGDSFLAKYFPDITKIGVSVFSYLGYGIYTIGVSFYEIVLSSFKGLIALMIPAGFNLLYGESLETILRGTIDMGVKWCPDFIKLIDLLGLPLFMGALLLLGRFTRYLQEGYFPALLKNVLIAIVYIQMLSLPVGNFIVSSSSNKLMVLFALIWFMQYMFLNITIKIRE